MDDPSGTRATPNPEAEQIRQALARFDAELRSSPEWNNWEARRNHRFAVEFEGRRYPAKQILSLASGRPLDTFSGGAQGANRVLAARGFQIVPLRNASPDERQPMARFRAALQEILAGFEKARTEKYVGAHPVVQAFESAALALRAMPEIITGNLTVVPSAGRGNWSSIPWISLLDPRETDTTQRGVYVVYLFRDDMSGLYVTLNQGVTELKELGSAGQAAELERRAKELRTRLGRLAEEGFELDNNIELRAKTSLGARYQPSTIANKFYAADSLPEIDELAADVNALLEAYGEYVAAKQPPMTNASTQPQPLSQAFEHLLAHIAATGFVFEPWHLAAYVTALRTKPFVILAGISGTGKSKLPQLVATATAAVFKRVAVRPDWTDSSDVLGYVDLREAFRPGAVLQFANDAQRLPGQQHVCLLDEMNLARVEQYFAEMLSAMEDRTSAAGGGFASPPLIVQKLGGDDAGWAKVGWPPNLALVGTVNMDESTHGFSRKVLDRAFTLEMSDVDLGNWKEAPNAAPVVSPWPSDVWYPRALRLSDLRDLSDDEGKDVARVVSTLNEANAILGLAQVQVGYRVRDEVALFVLHARELQERFRTQTGDHVDPLDLAINMKVLPRLAGGSGAIRRVLSGLLGWAMNGNANPAAEDVAEYVRGWDGNGRRSSIQADGVRLPRTAARLCLMWDRLQQEGFTSYWL